MIQICRINAALALWALLLSAHAAAAAADVSPSRALPPIPLSLNEVLAWVDRSHPLLQGTGTEKIVARGRFLKALGAFEPVLVNDTELERFIPRGSVDSRTGGFNDTFIELRDPSGVRGIAGYRRAIGDAIIPDLQLGPNNQALLGIFIPILRGLKTNPESAELKRSGFADPRAEVQIAQTRQDLFVAAANQYWDWIAAIKFADVQKRALRIAEDRLKQIEQRAKAGAVAPLDVVEANQEVQRRREMLIGGTRAVEQEQYKLSMFLWEGDAPTTPPLDRAAEFPKEIDLPSSDAVRAQKLSARAVRPEVREVEIEAKLNNIDLELAKNNLLPSLDAEAAPARNPEKFVLGLGYRFGLEMRIPFLQRRARGEVLEAQGRADRLVLVQKYREQQILVDVDNALSAIERAKERIAASYQALQMARTLEEGERFRFSLGATSVLFVNLRERNAVDSESQWIRAQADYQKALAFYQWAIGTWAKSPAGATPVSYKAIQ
ncbi:MAG TPA: TolC family protein [Nitrospiraceae bacterium]|nr:TolC family protein [Nitrospiraceae bacterium]